MKLKHVHVTLAILILYIPLGRLIYVANMHPGVQEYIRDMPAELFWPMDILLTCAFLGPWFYLWLRRHDK